MVIMLLCQKEGYGGNDMRPSTEQITEQITDKRPGDYIAVERPLKRLRETTTYSPKSLQVLCLRICVQYNALDQLKQTPYLFQRELDALKTIRDGLEIAGVERTIVQFYFDKQWGVTPLEQLSVFWDIFGKLPSEILKDQTINIKTFVNRNFIRAWRAIEIADIESTKTLDLSCKSIFYLPRNISRLKNLETLCLFNIDLSTLPPEIVALQKLKHFNLAYNKFETLPLVIFKLSMLETLSIYHNVIKIIPDEINKLAHLKGLSLSDNSFTSPFSFAWR